MKLILVDVARNYGALVRMNKDIRVNYEKYYREAKNGDEIHRAYAYGVCNDYEADNFIAVLKDIGYDVKYKKARMVKNKETNVYEPKIHLTSNNVEIAMDIVRNAGKIDTIVLGSNDKELIPVIKWAQEKGIKIHIFSLLIPEVLKELADSYQEIDDSVLDYSR